MKALELDFDAGLAREEPQYYIPMQFSLDVVLNCADPHTYLQVIKFKKQSTHGEPSLGGGEGCPCFSCLVSQTLQMRYNHVKQQKSTKRISERTGGRDWRGEIKRNQRIWQRMKKKRRELMKSRSSTLSETSSV